MPITATLDQFGKPAWIALLILSFIVWWPIGLMTLAFLIGSGRMGCGYGRHGGEGRFANKMERMQWKMDRMRERMGGFGGWNGPSSGNRAFDEYKADTIRRLEEEQQEFRNFLDQLRMSKDKAEFDQFMNDRRTRQTPENPAQN